MAVIGGFLQNQVIRDTRGATDNYVGGSHNNVSFVGDNGANTFMVGGRNNNVNIQNVGRDERIVLEGNPQDWQELRDGSVRNGQVTLHNSRTGNTVQIGTDAGRNDQFVKNKISFSGGYSPGALADPFASCCCHGGWNQLGNLSAYGRGYADGLQAGSSLGFWSGAAWGAWGRASFGVNLALMNFC
jgi:hypothetical protein